MFSFITVLAFCAVQPSVQAQQNALKSSDAALGTNGYLVSRNRLFFAQVRSYIPNKWGGGFSIYKGSGPDMNLGQIWTAKAESLSPNLMSLAMQPDANLCVYQAGMATYWCKDFKARPIGDYFAIMQDDGNLCIYAGKPESQGAGVWCTSSNTPVTWSVDGKQFKFSGQGAQGTPRTEALVPSGSTLAGNPTLADTNTRWVNSNGTMVWAQDTRQCMTLNADNTLSLQACGSGNQGGWGIVADGTLRKSDIANGCVDWKYDAGNFRDAVAIPKKAIMVTPCPSTAAKFTFN